MKGRPLQKSLRSITERNALVEANLGLVYKLFHVFAGWVRNEDFREDILQEGMLGLLRAADLYNPASGFRFSTYASYWVRCKMWGAMRRNRLIRNGPIHISTILDVNSWFRLRGMRGHMPVSDDMLHDPRSQDFLQDIEARDLAEHLIKEAYPQDRAILREWLAGRLLEDIARDHDISKQRVSQMKDRALERISKYLAQWDTPHCFGKEMAS